MRIDIDITSRVSTSGRYDTLSSAARVREAFYHLTGTWCQEWEAIAACYSVPDGAPVEFAALNVGVEFRELDRRDFERERANGRAALGIRAR